MALCFALAGTSGALEADERRTGFEDMRPELQAMQNDVMANPGLFWVLDGERLYGASAGRSDKSCRECHGPAKTAMAGVAARYPAWDETGAVPVDLSGRINFCRTRHQQAEPLARESDAMLSLTSFVTLQSRGMSIVPDPDPRLAPARAEGEAYFFRRAGQLNLACSHCHDDHAGERLLAAKIPEAHPTGYPQYRLQWETMGSLHRRFGNCLSGVRAKVPSAGAPSLIALELYLNGRAAGLSVEAYPIRP